MKISQKIQEMELSPIRKFVPYADAARKQGKKQAVVSRAEYLKALLRLLA